MSSLPDCVSPPLVPTPPPIPLVADAAPAAAKPKLPRTWFFFGTLLFGVFIFAVQNVAELATLLVLFVRSGAEPPQSPEQIRALLHNGGWLGWYLVVATPFTLGALWIPIRIARRTFSGYLALRRPDRGEVARGLGMLALFLAGWYSLRYLSGQSMPEFVLETYRTARADGTLVVYIIGVCVAAPVMEELVVRGFLFRGWSRSFLGIPGTIVLSSAAWASLHFQYNAFFITEIFTLGLLFGVLRHRSRSTWLTVILHAANNLLAVVHVALVS